MCSLADVASTFAHVDTHHSDGKGERHSRRSKANPPPNITSVSDCRATVECIFQNAESIEAAPEPTIRSYSSVRSSISLNSTTRAIARPTESGETAFMAASQRFKAAP